MNNRRLLFSMAVLVLAAFALVPAAAEAVQISGGRHRPRLIGVQHGGGFAADGARYAAFNVDGQTIRVYDSRRGRSVDIKSECQVSPGAAADGQFIVHCKGAAGDVPQLLDAKHRTFRAIPGSPPGDMYFEMGRQWLRGLLSDPTPAAKDPSDAVVPYFNWRSGASVQVPESEDRIAPRDIDSTNLPPVAGLPADSFLYGREKGRSLVLLPAGGGNVDGGLELRGRGGRVRLRKQCTGGYCGDTSGIASGRVAWTRPSGGTTWAVGGYVIRGRHRSTWRVRGLPTGTRPQLEVEVGHAARRLFLGVLTRVTRDSGGTEIPGAYKIYAARW